MVLSSCARELAEAKALMMREIGEFTAPLPYQGKPGEAPAALLFITRSIRYALESQGEKLDGVLHGLFIDDRDLPAGRQTIGKMWEVIPYENRLATAEFTGAELVLIMEEMYSGKYSPINWMGSASPPRGLRPKSK